LIFGSAKDIPAGKKMLKLTGDKLINLCGKTSIEDVIDLLGACKKVITNDSGLMHIAAAVGSKVHAIYGSSSPDYTPPLTENKQIYYSSEDCSPCFKRTCKFKHYNCLHKIDPEQIIAKAL